MNSKIYTTPKVVDVLCGRGSKPFLHPGNKLLRVVVASNLDEYNAPTCTRKMRSTMVTTLLRSIEEEGGRFLKFDDRKGEWYDTGYKEGRLKIIHAFRDASIPNKVKCIDEMRKVPKPNSSLTTVAVDPTIYIANGTDNDPVGPSSSTKSTSVGDCEIVGPLSDNLEPISYLAPPSRRISMPFDWVLGTSLDEGTRHTSMRDSDNLEPLSFSTRPSRRVSMPVDWALGASLGEGIPSCPPVDCMEELLVDVSEDNLDQCIEHVASPSQAFTIVSKMDVQNPAYYYRCEHRDRKHH